jgi:hypothetical protein
LFLRCSRRKPGFPEKSRASSRFCSST